jgi:hypothetical protein
MESATHCCVDCHFFSWRLYFNSTHVSRADVGQVLECTYLVFDGQHDIWVLQYLVTTYGMVIMDFLQRVKPNFYCRSLC